MRAYLLKIALLLFFLIIASLIEQNFSIFIWGVTWGILGCIVILTSFGKKNVLTSINIFFSFFIIYFIHAYLCNFFYVKNVNTDFFYAKDSLFFYKLSNQLGKLGSINEIFNYSFNKFETREFKGFAFLIGTVSYISFFFDSNSIVTQKLIPVFCSAVALPYLYSIVKLYFTERMASNLVYLYGIFSYSFFYSAVFVRDSVINLLFIVLIYFFLKNNNIKNVIVFSIISILIFSIRPEHGIFSLIFLIAYFGFYLKTTTNDFKIYLALIIITTFIFIIKDNITNYYSIIETTTNTYLAHSLAESDGGESLGVLLLKLPWGIRHITAGLFSQIIPFPFYIGFQKNGFGFLSLGVAALFWFFIWILIFKTVFTKRLRTIINFKMWVLFFIAFLLIVGNSVNVDTRRVMAVFPILFIFSMKSFLSLKKKQRNHLIFLSVSFYFLFLLTYLVIKNL